MSSDHQKTEPNNQHGVNACFDGALWLWSTYTTLFRSVLVSVDPVSLSWALPRRTSVCVCVCGGVSGGDGDGDGGAYGWEVGV
jgi:hypothetical protein